MMKYVDMEGTPEDDCAFVQPDRHNKAIKGDLVAR